MIIEAELLKNQHRAENEDEEEDPLNTTAEFDPNQEPEDFELPPLPAVKQVMRKWIRATTMIEITEKEPAAYERLTYESEEHVIIHKEPIKLFEIRNEQPRHHLCNLIPRNNKKICQDFRRKLHLLKFKINEKNPMSDPLSLIEEEEFGVDEEVCEDPDFRRWQICLYLKCQLGITFNTKKGFAS